MSSKLIGWIIGIAVAIFAVGLLVKVIFFPKPSQPSAALGGNRMEILAPEQPLTLIIPALPTGTADAGDSYAAAVKLCKDNAKAITAAKTPAHMSDLPQGKFRLATEDNEAFNRILDLVSAGAANAKMTYTFRLTLVKIELPYTATEAEDLYLMDGPLRMLALQWMAMGEDGFVKAEKIYFALLIAGKHMIDERARMEVVMTGIAMQDNACRALRTLYGDKYWKKSDRLEKVEQYYTGLTNFGGVYRDLFQNVIWKLNRLPNGGVCPYPGDILYLAENHPDRSIKTEAILLLGMVRLMSGERGDRRCADDLLNQYFSSPEPLIRAAATCAASLDMKGVSKLFGGK